MAKKSLEHITRKILKEEISASEQRLGAKIVDLDVKTDNIENRLGVKIIALNTKIETTAQSLKEYTDSRFNQLDTRIKTTDSSIKAMDSKIEGMDARMTRYFEGIVKMLERLTGTSAATRERLDDHEQRIIALEKRKN